MTEDSRRFVSVALLVLLALALRGWGLGFGLPEADARPDEMIVIRQAFRYGTGSLNPGSFVYPPLFSYLVFGGYGMYGAVLMALGRISAPSGIVVAFAQNPAPFFLIPRMLSAVAGTLTVLAAYAVAKRAFSKHAGLFAGGLTAVAYLGVREAHFGVTDSAMSCLVMVCVFLCLRLAERGMWRDYIFAAVVGGLATATKYNAALLGVAILTAHCLTPAMRNRRVAVRPLAGRLWCAALLFALTFLICSPYVLLDYTAFLRDFSWQVGHLGGAENIAIGRGWVQHARFTLWYGVGPLMLFAAIAGVVIAFRANWRSALVVLSFPVLYYIAMGKGYTVFSRHMAPLVPFICILAAVTVSEGILRISRRRVSERMAWAVALTCAVVIAAPTCIRSVRFSWLMSRPDSRQLAVRYVESALPAGAKLGWLGTKYGLPRFHETVESLEAKLAKVQQNAGSGRLVEAELAVARKREYGLHVQCVSPADLAGGEPLPAWILTEYYPLAWPAAVARGTDEKLGTLGYERKKVFAGASRELLDSGKMKFDVQDSFYAPFAGLRYVTNPGPTLTLWEKRG